MALNFIPKIQYQNATITGNRTSGSNVISGMSSVAGLAIGMVCEGSGIPVGTKILTVGTSSVTLDSNATSTASAATFDFYFLVSFIYPPSKDDDDEEKANNKVTPSLSGVNQTVYNYLEGIRKITYDFLTPTQKDALRTFYRNWAVYGNQFRYFTHASEPGYITYEIKDNSFAPKRRLAKQGDFIYTLSLSFRRVIQ